MAASHAPGLEKCTKYYRWEQLLSDEPAAMIITQQLLPVMEAAASPRRSSSNDVLALRLLRTNTWSCYCGLPLWGFTIARLKEIMRGMLSDLPDSEGRRPRLLCRPCNVLSDRGGKARRRSSAWQPRHRRSPTPPDWCTALGEGFGVALMALQLAPWQLSLVMLWGCNDLDADVSSEQCFLKLQMDSITLGFSHAQVLGQLPRSTGLTYDDGRKLLLAFCESASKEVFPFNYQQLPLRRVHFVDLFSVDNEGTMNVHKATLVPEIFEMLLSFAKNLVLGSSPSNLEEE
ncbi:hypothetical protein MTO96_036761 [Rhipicephalus appendiculatus]